MNLFISPDRYPGEPGYVVRDRPRGHRIGWVALAGKARNWRAICAYVGCRTRGARGTTRPEAAAGLLAHWQTKHIAERRASA